MRLPSLLVAYSLSLFLISGCTATTPPESAPAAPVSAPATTTSTAPTPKPVTTAKTTKVTQPSAKPVPKPQAKSVAQPKPAQKVAAPVGVKTVKPNSAYKVGQKLSPEEVEDIIRQLSVCRPS